MSRPAVATVAGMVLFAGLVLVGGVALWGGTVWWSPDAAAEEARLVSPVRDERTDPSGERCRWGDRDRAERCRPAGRADPEPWYRADPETSTLDPVPMRPAPGDAGTDDPARGTSGPAPDRGSDGGGGAAADTAGGAAADTAGGAAADTAGGAAADTAGGGAEPATAGSGDQPAAPPRDPRPTTDRSDPTGQTPAADPAAADQQLVPVARSTPGGRIGLLGFVAAVCVVAVSAGAVRTILSQRAARGEP